MRTLFPELLCAALALRLLWRETGYHQARSGSRVGMIKIFLATTARKLSLDMTMLLLSALSKGVTPIKHAETLPIPAFCETISKQTRYMRLKG